MKLISQHPTRCECRQLVADARIFMARILSGLTYVLILGFMVLGVRF